MSSVGRYQQPEGVKIKGLLDWFLSLGGGGDGDGGAGGAVIEVGGLGEEGKWRVAEMVVVLVVVVVVLKKVNYMR